MNTQAYSKWEELNKFPQKFGSRTKNGRNE